MIKRLRYSLEALLVRFFSCFFALLPPAYASATGGWLARTLGYHLSVTAVARDNLSRAIPSIQPEEREEILRTMWENLGRVAAEFTHIYRPGSAFINKYVTVKGLEHLLQVPQHTKGALLFSGHLGNWEILPKLASCHNIPLSFIYRPANNPVVDAIICAIRSNSLVHMFPKGIHGAKEIVSTLKKGRAVAMLVDQKMNDGISIPFFGRNAMTAPALAKLALKLGCPIIPTRVKRLHGIYFEVEILPPITVTPTENPTEDVYLLMLHINQTLETWIRETPEQWFWVHKRWPKEE